MINKEALEIIYNKNLNGEEITIEELENLNLSHAQIKKLTKKNIIKKIDSETYGLQSTEELFVFGVYLLNKNEIDKAYEVILKCHNNNPDSIEILECLFLCGLKKQTNKEELWSLLSKIINNHKKQKEQLNNLYLYYLTYINGSAPKEYILNMLNMQYKDLTLKKSTTEEEKQLAYDISKVINNVCADETLSHNQEEIIKEFIRQCLKVKKELDKKLLELAKTENYQEIIDILEERKKYIQLEYEHQLILVISKKIKEIIEKDIIPEPIIEENNRKTIFKIIENNYFEKAYTINLKYLTEKNKDARKNAPNILLNKIRNIILQKKQSKKLGEILRYTRINKEIENIILNLIGKNLNLAIEETKQYLKEINEDKFEQLLISLIEICYHFDESKYQDLIKVLVEITKHEYEYDITTFLRLFYKSLEENKVQIAKRYLNIIENYTPKQINIIESLKKDMERHSQNLEETEKIIKEYLFVALRELKNNNYAALIIDTKVPENIRNIIYRLIKKIPIKELRAFSIGEEPKQVVLRYLNPEHSNDLLESTKYSEAYHNKEYKKCIEIIYYLLEDPKYDGYNGQIYTYLGLSYYHLNNKDEAYKYLKIASGLNQIRKNKYKKEFDFNEILLKLIKEISPKEKKCEEQAFERLVAKTKEKNLIAPKTEKKQDRYADLKELAYYLKEEKIKLRDAVSMYNLSEEDIQIITLVYVKDYYTLSMYKEGDKLLQEVEKSKNKTPFVKKMLEKRRKNRLFYKHRENNYSRKRTL